MPSKGQKHTDEAKRKISESRLGDKHWNWKGDKVGYDAVHKWAKSRITKPPFCTKCWNTTNTLDLANISGEYKRKTFDWQFLCRKCHMIQDKRIVDGKILAITIKRLNNK